VTEHVETHETASEVAIDRGVQLCEVPDGRMNAAPTYRTGGLDDELRNRHVAHAP
jgi:hypothetical protein